MSTSGFDPCVVDPINTTNTSLKKMCYAFAWWILNFVHYKIGGTCEAHIYSHAKRTDVKRFVTMLSSEDSIMTCVMCAIF